MRPAASSMLGDYLNRRDQASPSRRRSSPALDGRGFSKRLGTPAVTDRGGLGLGLATRPSMDLPALKREPSMTALATAPSWMVRPSSLPALPREASRGREEVSPNQRFALMEDRGELGMRAVVDGPTTALTLKREASVRSIEAERNADELQRCSTEPISMARRRLVSEAQEKAVRAGMDKDARALMERLNCMPARARQALDACDGGVEQAEALLIRFKKLTDTAFASKTKAAVRRVVAMDKALVELRRAHSARLAQVEQLSRLVEQASRENETEFAKTVAGSSEEEVEALSFAVNSALISGLGADALPWSRFAKELDTVGITARHGALSRPEGFFEQLHAQERQVQEKLIRDTVTSATSAMVNLAPALQPHLAEFGLTLEDVLPVLAAACHTDWDEVKTLLDDPRLLVRQAAAVKCPTATFEFSFHIEMDYSVASADLDGLEHKFAQQLGVSRMQLEVSLSKTKSSKNARAKVKVVTIDADAGSALIERLKCANDNSATVLGAQLLAFPVILGIQMNKHKRAEKCNFHLLLASQLRQKDAPALCATRHQDIDRSWFRSVEVTMQGVLEALYAGKVLVVSHRWCEPGRPDPDGVQEQAIKSFLHEHPEIEYVWQDFWSMPQSERSEAELTDFEAMLMSVNLLYLGGTVLVLLDQEYMSRFWTSAEAWLSTRSCTSQGLQPAENPQQRCKIVLLPDATQEAKGALLATWSGKTIEEACALLEMDDVKVTNQSDKAKLLSKLVGLHETIQGAWAAKEEAKLVQEHSPLAQIIDKKHGSPLLVGGGGELAEVPADHPERASPEVAEEVSDAAIQKLLTKVRVDSLQQVAVDQAAKEMAAKEEEVAQGTAMLQASTKAAESAEEEQKKHEMVLQRQLMECEEKLKKVEECKARIETISQRSAEQEDASQRLPLQAKRKTAEREAERARLEYDLERAQAQCASAKVEQERLKTKKEEAAKAKELHTKQDLSLHLELEKKKAEFSEMAKAALLNSQELRMRMRQLDADAVAYVVSQSVSLTTLDLNDQLYDGSKAIAGALTANSSLRTLNLSGNMIGEEGSKAIADALKANGSLTVLDLSRNRIGEEGSKAIGDALKVNESLTRLDLSWNRIGEQGSKAIGDALKLNGSLMTLHLSRNFVIGQGAKAIGNALKVNSSLTEISLSETSMGEEEGAAIAEALKSNSSLTCLRSSHLGQNGSLAMAQALKVNKTLQILHADGNRIDGELLAPGIAASRSLTELHLSDNMNQKGWCAIFDSLRTQKKSKIAKWVLTGAGINSAIAKSLAAYVAVSKSLRELHLEENSIGHLGAKAISEALTANGALTALHLAFNRISTSDTKAIAEAVKVHGSLTALSVESFALPVRQLMGAEQVERLDLSGKQKDGDGDIGPLSAIVIAKCLETNTSLTSLNLSSQKLGGHYEDDGYDSDGDLKSRFVADLTGLRALAEALKVNNSLTELDLGDNEIRNDGTKAIAEALRRNSSLKDLDLDDNRIGKKGSVALAKALKVNGSLTRLNMEYNNLTDAGVSKLRDAVQGRSGFELSIFWPVKARPDSSVSAFTPILDRGQAP